MKVADLEAKYPGYAWRYTSAQAAAKHAVRRRSGDRAEGVGDYISAECGNGPVWYGTGWLGTGSQKEYERNDELRECKRCIDRLTLGGQSHRMPGGAAYEPSPEERRGSHVPGDLHAPDGPTDVPVGG